jgi:hypothetical protein
MDITVSHIQGHISSEMVASDFGAEGEEMPK